MKIKPGQNCFKCESSAHHMFLKITCFCRHDFNDSLGKVKIQSFQDKFPAALADFQMAWVEYMKYCYQVESGAEVDVVAQNQPTNTLWELDQDVKGYPMLPVAWVGDDLSYMKN